MRRSLWTTSIVHIPLYHLPMTWGIIVLLNCLPRRSNVRAGSPAFFLLFGSGGVHPNLLRLPLPSVTCRLRCLWSNNMLFDDHMRSRLIAICSSCNGGACAQV